MQSVETRTVEPDEAGMRLDRWFKAHFPELSFGHLQKLVRSGQVRVDGGRVKTSTRLGSGQAVRVPPLAHAAKESALPADGRSPKRAAGEAYEMGRVKPSPTRGKTGGSDGEFLRSILLHEDDQVFVFNKPAGLA